METDSTPTIIEQMEQFQRIHLIVKLILKIVVKYIVRMDQSVIINFA